MNPNNSLRNSILMATSFVAVIWGLAVYTLLSGAELHTLGVIPRNWSGLSGILTAPLFHSSWQHLLSNTLPLLLLGSLLLYGYPKSRWWSLSLIWLLSGVGVWLFARSSYHIGASGLAHGMFFYLFVGGILRRDKRSATLLMIAFYMYGGMLLTIFPRDPSVSFESHFFGGAAGALCAWLFRKRDPKPVRRRYSWEAVPGSVSPDEEEEDPVIGDQWKT